MPPNKDTQTRKKIKDKALDTKADIQNHISQAKDELAQTIDEKKAIFEEKLEKAVSNMNVVADDIINALVHKLEALKKCPTEKIMSYRYPVNFYYNCIESPTYKILSYGVFKTIITNT